MFHTVYYTKNLVNNKYYIGKHSTLNIYDKYIGSGNLLKSAMKKHGKHNFIKYVLYVSEDESASYKIEEFLIELLDAQNDKNSYNLSSGGRGVMKGRRHTEKAKQNIKTKNTGKKRTEEQRQRISQGSIGKTISDEQKDKISKTLTGRTLSDETKMKISKSCTGRSWLWSNESKLTIKGRPSNRKGVVCSDETKMKMSIAQKGRVMSDEAKRNLSIKNTGAGNHNYGKKWINNGEEDMKIMKDEALPIGWCYGRCKQYNQYKTRSI